jgi:transposase-like protein
VRQLEWSHFAAKGESQVPKKGTGWYPQEFREMAVERSRTCLHLGRLCKELGIDPHTLRTSRKKVGAKRDAAPPGIGTETVQEENRRLKRALAEKVLEVDFFKGALQKVEVRRQQSASNGAKASTTRSGE